ncbi:MAG: ATP-binding cassette domain-containing protein [Gammaproteobacteria bacterium]|nr:ATP-binding cassette domain-containing protein [Gammaproteobacteria bacterium]
MLEVRDLVKRYPQVNAVNGVSFCLQAGTCFGLLGPNGAGKTTTVEILEGIHAPTAGEILYKGEHLGKRFRNEAGIMFQSTALQDYITVRETLEMFARLYPKNTDLDMLIQRCNLRELLKRDNRQLSGGQRQRLLLAVALVNDPDILFLDEPTTGLDPQARRNFWDLIESVKAEGKTILLTTHYMDEAYVLCDEIAIMDHGKIIAQGSPENLLKAHFNDTILQLPAAALADTDALPYPVHKHNSMLEITTSDVNQTIEDLLSRNISLHGLQVRSRNLDDLFLELTGKTLRA